MSTETGQIPHRGRPVLAKGNDPVVDLQPVSHVTAGDHTGGVPLYQGDLQRGRYRPSQVTDGGHVDPVGDDQVAEGVSHQLGGCLDRDGAHPGDLTDLAIAYDPGPQGIEIDPDMDTRPGDRVSSLAGCCQDP